MSKIQLISCYINLAGDRNNVVFRGEHDAVTFPEALVLQSIHGGQEHVHTMIDVGVVERDLSEELARLSSAYGQKIVSDLFPSIAGKPSLPAGDDAIPTLADVKAAAEASEQVLAASKTKTTGGKTAAKTPAKAPAEPAPAPAPTDAIPSLDNLPGGDD